MKLMTKKMLAGMVAGAVLLAGGVTCVQAAQDRGNTEQMAGRQGFHQPPQMDKEKIAEKIAGTFQVSKDEVLNALNSREDFHNVGQAAMLAKLSGKSFGDVMAMKTKDNRWRDVQDSLGITREQIRNEMDSLSAARIAEHGNVDLAAAKALLKNGYAAQDIEMAGILAKESGKTLQAVLDMKKINNRWTDVAKSLGVDAKKLHKNWQGHGGPNGMMPHDRGNGPEGPMQDE